MLKDYKTLKLIMRAIGIPLLVIGIIMVIIGFSSFYSGCIMIFGLGGFMVVIGFALISISIVLSVSKYYTTEASSAIKIASQSVGERLKELGFGSS